MGDHDRRSRSDDRRLENLARVVLEPRESPDVDGSPLEDTVADVEVEDHQVLSIRAAYFFEC
jgi:hypothetical protein